MASGSTLRATALMADRGMSAGNNINVGDNMA